MTKNDIRCEKLDTYIIFGTQTALSYIGITVPVVTAVASPGCSADQALTLTDMVRDTCTAAGLRRKRQAFPRHKIAFLMS